jgi:IS5 family transposase
LARFGQLLHGKEEVVYADAGYTCTDKRIVRKNLQWKTAARRGRIQAMPEGRKK